MTDWSKPIPVSDIVLAFPATVTGTLLPPVEDIPKEFFGVNKWTRLADLCFAGTPPDGTLVTTKPTLDYALVVRQLKVCLGSFEPKHENKIAGVAYLMSLFFTDVEFQ